MSRRPLLVLLVMTAGCLNEYHPEYHPQTSTTYVQNVSYPTTYVTQVLAPPPVPTSRTSTARRERRAPAWAWPGAAQDARDASPQEVAVPLPASSAQRREAAVSPRPPVAEGIDLGNDDRVLRTAPGLDLGELKARCRSGDRAGCRELPGIHISGNVQIHGNVTLFGDVYLNDSPPSS